VDHPLESALLKLDRSRKHVNELETGFRASVESDTYEPTHEMNLETGHYRIVAGPLDPPPRLSTVLGDAVQNARAALEHVVWATVVQNLGGIDPPNPRHIMFPIDDSARRFNGRAVLRFLRPDQRAVLQSHQPYLRRGKRKRSILEMLRELSDTDKHRKLRLLANAVSPEHDPLVGEPVFHNCGNLIEPYHVLAGGALYPGAPLASFYFAWLRPESRVEVQFEIALAPVIREGDRMWPCWPLLDQIPWHVRKVIRDFEPFFPPLPVERKTLDARLHDASTWLLLD
jgi:hypothetical protein